MKTLREFNEQYYKYVIRNELYKGSFDKFMEINNLSEDQINEEIIDVYYRLTWGNTLQFRHNNPIDMPTNCFVWINEMLESHDVKYLLRNLNKEFVNKGYKAIKILSEDKSKSEISGVELKVSKDLFINKNDYDLFEQIIDKFMWFVSNIEGYENEENDYLIIHILPIKGTKCTDFIFKECKGILYHITKKENIKKIEHTGLRAKSKNHTDMFNTNRLFFCCGKNIDDIKETIKDVSKSKYDKTDKNDLVVIKINISKLKYIEFYRDPTDYENSDSVFTFVNIPPKFIEGYIKYTNLIKE